MNLRGKIGVAVLATTLGSAFSYGLLRGYGGGMAPAHPLTDSSGQAEAKSSCTLPCRSFCQNQEGHNSAEDEQPTSSKSACSVEEKKCTNSSSCASKTGGKKCQKSGQSV